MNVITDREFTDFLINKPLYSKIKAVTDLINAENNFTNPLDFQNKAFNFICPYEKKSHTFRTEVFGGSSGYFGRRASYPAKEMPMYFDQETKSLDLTVFLPCTCQSCHKSINFLLKATTDKPWTKYSEGIALSIQKIGQWPAHEIAPDPIVVDYLTKEDNEHYKKALVCLSVNYGIGAFAYFRRIIENEIKRIVKDISEMDIEGANDIKEAYKKYETDHQMASLITSITAHLPKSLLELGDNPIRLLHDQLSGGIHVFSEEICIDKAQLINVILSHTIKKVNEEKFQKRDVKDAIRKLKSYKAP